MPQIRIEDVQVGDQVLVEDPRGRWVMADPPYEPLNKTVCTLPEIVSVRNPYVRLTFYGEGFEDYRPGELVWVER